MAKGKKILVVDDDRSSLEYLTYLLQQSGYEVSAVENGAEALERARSDRPDLVISDILMPEMDGFQLAQKLRAKPGSSDIPVIFYSATYSDPEARRLASAAGLARRVDKPAEPHVVLKAVQDALGRPQAKPAFDSSLFSEQHVRVLTQQLAEKVQALTDANEGLTQIRNELQAATGSLRKSEEQYRLLFEANPNPMWVFDVDTLRFLAVNSAAIAWYGFSKQEFLDMTINDLRPAVEIDRFNIAAANKAEDQQFSEPWKHKKKDGTLIDVEITSRVTTFDGRPARLMLAQDVTLRKQLEETLRQAQKVEAVALLASGVAHDFNNLLGIILGCTELAMLRLDEGSPAASKLIDVKSAAQRAARLTRQLMLFSSREVTEAQTVDLNESVAGSERFLRRLIAEDIDIACAFAGQPLNIRIDPSHLEQLLLNLVVNARDAMPKGGRIRIETALADLSSGVLDPSLRTLPGSYALLTVSDTGQGMNPETRSRIFEPFFTTKEKGKGTGLGLATVDGIVKQAGGHIVVYSELGAGTTFKILFPLASAPAEAAAFVEKPVAPSRGETILVTEDEPALRGTIVESLEESGYKVFHAASGAEAIAIVDQRHGVIDLLLSDVIMPGMSGAELSLQVTRKYPNMHVLLMTGYSDDTLSRHGMSRAARVMQKPFTRHALLQRVGTLLDATKAISKRYKILVAEDDPTYRQLMSDVLQASGFEVLCAHDGTRAVLHGLAQPIDLAVVDIEMPRRSGLSVCQKLKSDPSIAHVPVLVVSGTLSKGDKDLAFSAGANAFLCKPFTSDELLSSVKALLPENAVPGASAPSLKRSVWVFGGEAGL